MLSLTLIAKFLTHHWSVIKSCSYELEIDGNFLAGLFTFTFPEPDQHITREDLDALKTQANALRALVAKYDAVKARAVLQLVTGSPSYVPERISVRTFLRVFMHCKRLLSEDFQQIVFVHKADIPLLPQSHPECSARLAERLDQRQIVVSTCGIVISVPTLYESEEELIRWWEGAMPNLDDESTAPLVMFTDRECGRRSSLW